MARADHKLQVFGPTRINYYRKYVWYTSLEYMYYPWLGHQLKTRPGSIGNLTQYAKYWAQDKRHPKVIVETNKFVVRVI